MASANWVQNKANKLFEGESQSIQSYIKDNLNTFKLVGVTNPDDVVKKFKD